MGTIAGSFDARFDPFPFHTTVDFPNNRRTRAGRVAHAAACWRAVWDSCARSMLVHSCKASLNAHPHPGSTCTATAACCICGRSGRGAAATPAVTRHPTSRGIRATSMLPLWGDGHPPRQSRILARPVSAAPQSCPAPHTRAAACPSPIPPSTRVRSPGWRDPASLGARACKLQNTPSAAKSPQPVEP